MANDPTVPISSGDPLGETLHLLRLTGTLYCRSELTAPWGIDLPPIEGCMMFHIITAGRCYLQIPGEEPSLLRRGDLVLLPHGSGHKILSGPEVETDPLFDIPVDKISERYEIMRHGGGGEFTGLTCGVLRFDQPSAQRLVESLPPILHSTAWDGEPDGWMQSTIRLITSEATELRPGGETVITRLADILVIQAIRAWIDTAPEARQGWLAALRDEKIGRSLNLIHRAPEKPWSVAGLANASSMSRSAFSARFTELLGESPVRYLTRWRMQLARQQIQNTPEPLYRIAEQVGYESESAFCRAFKREYAQSPGSLRSKVLS
ncbi:MAG: AraC family transcriptional regulator [Planctomycetota bacterium]|nr:AraC family transcriptional regulator [Planctomycetota bacterium]